jgi:hypothetical protein
MGYRNTRVDVESVLRDLNAASRDLGLSRTFEVRYGSSANGVQHVLEEHQVGSTHPTMTQIGKTYRAAHDYLVPMVHALRSAKRDRDYRRNAVASRDANGAPSFERDRRTPAPVNSVGIYDPDARSVTRYPDRPDAWHPELPT